MAHSAGYFETEKETCYLGQKNINVVTWGEAWIHFFELHRKISNRIWLTKDIRRPCIAKRIASMKNVMYAIFVTTKELAIKVPVPKGKSMNARFYKKKFWESLSNSARNGDQRQVSEACICYMTTSQVTRLEVWHHFLLHRGIYVLEHPPYSPDLALSPTPFPVTNSCSLV